ncbi:DUF302 domain-containing protein [Nisaea sp.]|uniref:DUF302 domain-containing protein n=1 Tax=Nisaea sp. TaxID=2024842 RepID=UPI003298229D
MSHKLHTSILAVLFLGVITLAPGLARADGDGMIVKTSDFGVTKTLDRLGIALERAGITVFARIDHAKGAKKVGMELAPTALIIFGTPKIGTPLMQSNPQIGLDLPLKALAWQAADGSVKLGYTDPAWLAKRHGIADRDAVFKKMTGALNKFTNMAVKKGGLPKE